MVLFDEMVFFFGFEIIIIMIDVKNVFYWGVFGNLVFV